MLLAIHSNTRAQPIPMLATNVAYANITCVVVSPIVITKMRDMHFGSIVSGTKGSITLPPDGGRPISTGSVGLQSSANTTSTATFEVSDNMGNNPSTIRMFTEYTITLPTNDVVLVNEEGKTMRVGNFTSNPASSQKGTLVNGIGQLSVGATLFVEADQGLGQYASTAPFPVTVNFN
ncbi:MAG: DUF4402 domain-containing protein [Prolixibacteraceae bacterium]|nr:DUF4402 domain-containing protein [Prolixibacteraceae bacterium]